jgi:GH24 family phage-related lysozyme (muramidase)
MSGSLPQLQTFQLPDVGGVVNALQGLELNRMRSQQLQGAEQERTATRELFSRPGFDPFAPGSSNELLRVAPTTGAATFQALMRARADERAGQASVRQAQTALTENEIKSIELGQALLRPVRDLPEAERPRAYATWLAGMERRIPGFSASAPREYSDAGYYTLLAKASEIVANQRPPQYTITPTSGGVIATDPKNPTNSFFVPAGDTPPNAPPPPGAPAPRAAAPGLTPGQAAAADFLRRREGFREAPYYDVNAYRAGFGSDTTTLPDGTVVPVRQGMTVSREDAERDLARRVPEFTQRAAAAIGEERFAALPPNAQAALISIAYNYGTLPGRIREAARSGDLAALSQAVAGLAGDNQGVNAGRRREEATMIAGGNAMAPNAAPANAMLAPPSAAMVRSDVPQLPLDPSAGSLARADYQKRMLDAIQQLEVKRIDAERARADQPARVQEAGQTAGATARAQAEVRGNLPPPPAGYRYNQDFTAFEPVPGSPQAQAVTERRGAQVAAANVVTRDIDRILERLDTAVLPVTGMGAPTMAALVGGSPAADVAELRKTIEGNISFNKLNELRQQSPTGGALGNVTDKDLELLKTTLGSLNQNQSPRQFRENLLNLRNAFMEVIHGPNFRDVAPPAREPPAPERLPGRRGAPPTGNRPTLEQFLERARPANPNASTEDLTSYYNRTYGGR